MTSSPSHLVQFYGGKNEQLLITAVAEYVADGLARRQQCVIAATQEHRQAFLDEMRRGGTDVDDAVESQALLLLDATRLAEELLEKGAPSARLFNEKIAAHMRLCGAGKAPGTRIYGEIVGVYTSQGRSDLAAQLEDIWNDFLRDHNATLYCGYPIDVFEPGFSESEVHSIMCGHSSTLTAVDTEEAVTALYAALDEILGANAKRVRDLMFVQPKPGWASLPTFEGCVLWLRRNLRLYAEDIMRSVEARLRAE